MQPSSQRRVHSAEFKATVLSECQLPGTSVAAVALSHGLNVNLLRKWLVGRGIKRAGLTAPRTVSSRPASEDAPGLSQLQFVPVALPEAAGNTDKVVDDEGPSGEPSATAAVDIQVELRRGSTQLTVRWPSSQADACAAWLRELAGTALKTR